MPERPDAARIRDDLATTPATRPELRRALDRLAGLRAMDALIIRRTPLAELAPFALRHLRSLVAAGRASVIIYDHASGTGTIVAVDEDRPAAVEAGSVFPLEAIVPAELLAVPETRIYPDMATQLAELAAVPRMVAAGYRAACWSPMIADGALVGMLAMGAADPATFAGDAAEIAAEVAGQLAVAVRAERDRDAAGRSAARLELLHRVDRAILDAESMVDLARRTAGLVRDLAAAERVVIARYEPARGIGYRLASSRAGEEPPEETLVPVALDRLVSPAMIERPTTIIMRDLGAAADSAPGVSFMVEQGLRAGVFVPLVAHGALQGGLIIGWRDPALLTDEHIAIAGEVADQMAIAILHADAHERLERSAARLELVHEIDRSILAARDTGEIAAGAVARLRHLAGAERVSVTRYDLERGVARVLAFDQSGEGGAFGPGAEMPLAGVLPRALRERHEPVLISDMAAAAEELPGFRIAVDQGMRATALVPLVAGDTLVGVITLAGPDDRVLQEDNLAVAMEVADQLAVAILGADARLRLEHSLERLDLLHEVDLAILASESMEDLAGRVAVPLARLASAKRLDISVYDLERDEGRVVAFAHDGNSTLTPVGLVYPLRAVVPMVSVEAPVLMAFDDIRRFAGEVPLVRSAVEAGLVHGLWIPLVADGRLLGAIGMAGDDPTMTGPEVMDMARSMGDQLAVALQHAADRDQLAERERRLGAILGASPNGILAVDKAGVIQYANPAAHCLFRAAEGDLAGRRHATLVPPAAMAAHPAKVAQWFDDPAPATTHPLDTEAVRLDGTTFPVHVLLAPVMTAAGPLAIATVVDLSERAALEARLRQAERLETLGQFAGILAHDVRNYLTAISWSAELLESEMAQDDPRIAELEMIRKATDDAIDMTRTVLEFARPTGDPTGVLDVASHLSGARTMLTRILGRGIGLEFDVDPDLPRAGINATAFTQVLGNLASNAHDAMPDGGTVRITARLHEAHGSGAEAGGLDPGRYVRVAVADTGVGMDEDTRRRAFEAFYTTKTMASTARGTGLGLSSVFLIVTKAGGSVRVESVPGLGTTFTVDLPAIGAA